MLDFVDRNFGVTAENYVSQVVFANCTLSNIPLVKVRVQGCSLSVVLQIVKKNEYWVLETFEQTSNGNCFGICLRTLAHSAIVNRSNKHPKINCQSLFMSENSACNSI